MFIVFQLISLVKPKIFHFLTVEYNEVMVTVMQKSDLMNYRCMSESSCVGPVYVFSSENLIRPHLFFFFFGMCVFQVLSYHASAAEEESRELQVTAVN